MRIRISDLYIPYVATIVLWPRYLFFPLAGVGVSPFSILTLLLLVVSLYFSITSNVKPLFGTVVLSRYLLCFSVVLVFWLFFCDVLGEYPEYSLPATGRNFVYVYSAMIIGSQIFKNAAFRNRFPLVLTVCVLLVSLIGIYERLTSSSFVASLPISHLASAGQQVSVITQGFYREGLFRASSVFVHPIVFGQFVAGCIPFAMSLVLQEGKFRKAIGLLAVVAILGAIYSSNTRSPYIVVTVSASVFIVLTFFSKLTLNRAYIAIAFVPLVFILLVSTQDFYSELIQGRTKVEMGSSAVRNNMLQTGLSVIQGSPLIGYGDGRSPFKAGMVGMNGILTIDNGYLSWALDFGYIGFALFVLVFGLAVLLGVRSASENRPSSDSQLLRCSVSYIAGVFVGLYVISIYDNLIVSSLLVGCIYSAHNWRRFDPLHRMRAVQMNLLSSSPRRRNGQSFS